MGTKRFSARIIAGHKENAVEVPFDPGGVWGSAPVAVRSGQRGHPVIATVRSVRFESFIVARSRKHWLLLNDETMRRIGVATGDEIAVTVGPRDLSDSLDVDAIAVRAFDKVVAAFAGQPAVTLPEQRRRAFGSNALKVNGKIFAMLAQGTLVVKLSKERVAALVASGRGVPFDAGRGRAMKEWIALRAPTKDWVALAREAYAHQRPPRAR